MKNGTNRKGSEVVLPRAGGTRLDPVPVLECYADRTKGQQVKLYWCL